MKLEHLIRDRPFILKTDNKNLTYLNTSHREKVKRWKIAIQHYDFKTLHIPGVENIEADAFSRLIKRPTKDSYDYLDETFDHPENILHQLGTEDFEQKPLQPLDPKIYQKIKDVHGDKFGHGGVQRTVNLLTQKKQTWRGMRKDVRNFIERCPCCQKLNRTKIRNNINPFTLASTNVMERIAIDTIGPAILDWISQFGCPSEIVSLCQRILNTMTHTSLGVSPSMMLYGGIVNHDTHFLTPYFLSIHTFWQSMKLNRHPNCELHCMDLTGS
jgi:hypothetical protein